MFPTGWSWTIKTRSNRGSLTIQLFILVMMMDNGNSRTIYNELIPKNSEACAQFGGFGCICETNVDCNQEKYLECIDGKCVCQFPRRRTFDYNLGKCVSLVGSFCGEHIPQCMRNSECEGGRCGCRAGYGKTNNNSCMINYLQECGNNDCNVDRGLACKEGKCQCLDSSFVYSTLNSNCIDPEAVVKNVIQRLAEMLIRTLLNSKVRKVINKATLPFRIFRRLTFGGLG